MLAVADECMVEWSVASVTLCACMSVCPHSERKTAWAINTKVSGQYTRWRALGMDWPWGQKVKGRFGLALGLWLGWLPAWVCMSIQLSDLLLSVDQYCDVLSLPLCSYCQVDKKLKLLKKEGQTMEKKNLAKIMYFQHYVLPVLWIYR